MRGVQIEHEKITRSIICPPPTIRWNHILRNALRRPREIIGSRLVQAFGQSKAADLVVDGCHRYPANTKRNAGIVRASLVDKIEAIGPVFGARRRRMIFRYGHPPGFVADELFKEVPDGGLGDEFL